MRGLRNKIGCTSCTNWTIYFEVWGVSDENSSTLKRLKLGTVSSFHPHSMCTKVERVTAKNGCTSCTNWTISVEVWGVSAKTHLLWKGWNLACYHHFTHIACVQKYERVTAKTGCTSCKSGQSPSKYEGFRTKTHLLWKGWNLAWYHHFTHIACVQNSRGLRPTLDTLRVQTGPSPTRYEGFRRKLIYSEMIESWHYIIISPT